MPVSWQNLKSLVLAEHSLGNISSSSGINEKKNGKEARRTRSSWLAIEYRSNIRSNSGTVPVRNDRLPLFNLQCEKKNRSSTSKERTSPLVYSPKCATFSVASRVLARGRNRMIIFSWVFLPLARGRTWIKPSWPRFFASRFCQQIP